MRHETRRPHARTLLTWIFARGNDLVTCELAQEGSRYAVRLRRQGGLKKALVATFDAGLSAFQSHAALAAELRRLGWMVVAYR